MSPARKGDAAIARTATRLRTKAVASLASPDEWNLLNKLFMFVYFCSLLSLSLMFLLRKCLLFPNLIGDLLLPVGRGDTSGERSLTAFSACSINDVQAPKLSLLVNHKNRPFVVRFRVDSIVAAAVKEAPRHDLAQSNRQERCQLSVSVYSRRKG